jgi:hypothetical protein
LELVASFHFVFIPSNPYALNPTATIEIKEEFMVRCMIRICVGLVFLSFALPIIAQQSATPTDGVVPALMNFGGVLVDANGKPLTGMVGVTFFLYKDSQGGSPLWLETQNVQPDSAGRYKVALGSASNRGLPPELFVSGEARWLGVQIQGQAEQPRVLLLSVPYALKAGDAQTVGGLPPSAFVMAVPMGGTSSATSQGGSSTEAINPALGGSGTTNFIPLWTPNGTTLGNSVFFQSGSGATAKVGLGLTNPLATLDINGITLVRGVLETITKGIATPTKGFNSNPLDQEASAYSSSTHKAVMQHFEWQAEPTGNNTTSPGATLNLLFGTDTNTPAETGLKLSKAGVFTFASGQTFPGTGDITGVTAGTDLTGGGLSGNVTLNLDTTKVPQLNASNSFTGNQSTTGNLTAGGTVVGDFGSFLGSTSNPDFFISNSGSGDALEVSVNGGRGVIVGGSGYIGFGNSSVQYPLVGEAPSTGENGVFGSADNDADFLAAIIGEQSGSTTRTIGVEGYSASGEGIGVYGQKEFGSNTGADAFGNAGVWGDTGVTGAWGSLGTADDGNAMFALNNSVTYSTMVINNEEGSSSSAFILDVSSGYGGFCNFWADGSLHCNGALSDQVPTKNGKDVSLYAVQSTENWFEDFGSGQLGRGSATISLEPTFAQTVNTGMDYHVFLTPNGDCKGLYVSNKTAAGFEVRELGGGTSNVAFDYRIVAKRKGYENVRLAEAPARSRAPIMPAGMKTRPNRKPMKISVPAKPIVSARR